MLDVMPYPVTPSVGRECIYDASFVFLCHVTRSHDWASGVA